MATEYAADIATREPADPGEHPVTKIKAPELPDEQDVLNEFNARFRHSREHFSLWRAEARDLYDMITGRQWAKDDEELLKNDNRPMVTFNLAGKYLDAIVGLQINNRQDIKFLPRELGDAKPNELLTGAVQWGRDLTDVADDETDAFYDAVLTGYGWVQGFLDRDVLSEGVPTGQRVDCLEMFPDPAARKRNLTDGRYVIRIKFVDRDEYAELTGASETDDTEMAELVAEEDDVLTIIEEPQDYRKTGSTDTRKRTRKPVAEYEFWRRETQMLVQVEGFNPGIMELHEWQAYEPFVQQSGRPYKAEPVKRKVYYRARICAGRVHELKRSPYQEDFTYHAITGKRDRNQGVFYGIGRALVDPQKWVNKFFSTILYAMMVGAKGGILAEENAFTDPRKAESEWANPSAITWAKDKAIVDGKIMPKPMAQYPEGLDRLMQFSMNAIPQVSGLNAELLGLAERIQAGVVEAQRKQSAMAIISWAFDAMRRYYRSMGRQMAYYVQHYMPEGTLVLVSGEGGRQYVPLIKNQLSLSFDVVVDEAPTSINMKERVWAVLETLIPQALQAGLKIPQEILDYSPLPTELVEKWKAVLQVDPKQQALAEKSATATVEKLVAEVQKTMAGAELDKAKVAEIMAEISKPTSDSLEMFKAQVDAQVKANIAEFKTNREAETRMLVEQMKIDSAERIAVMEARIDAALNQNKIDTQASLQRSKQETDTHAKLAVAAIARGKPEMAADDSEKPDPVALVAEAIGELRQAVGEMTKAQSAPQKPRKFKIKRNAKGEMAEVEEG